MSRRGGCGFGSAGMPEPANEGRRAVGRKGRSTINAHRVRFGLNSPAIPVGGGAARKRELGASTVSGQLGGGLSASAGASAPGAAGAAQAGVSMSSSGAAGAPVCGAVAGSAW